MWPRLLGLFRAGFYSIETPTLRPRRLRESDPLGERRDEPVRFPPSLMIPGAGQHNHLIGAGSTQQRFQACSCGLQGGEAVDRWRLPWTAAPALESAHF